MRNSSWALCTAAVLTGVMGLQIVFVQPMADQVESLTAQVASVQQGVNELTASADNAAQTNNLLAHLKIQGQRTQTARSAVDQIRRFEHAVRTEGHAARNTLRSLKNIEQLHQQIAAQEAQLTDLAEELDELSAFQQQVHGLASAAAREHVGVDRAEQLVRELGQLKQTVTAQAEDVEEAVDRLHRLARLKQAIAAEADGVGQASESLRQLGQLKEQVTDEADGLELAETQLKRLGEFHASAAAINKDQIATAESRLADLEHLKNLIMEGAQDVASAVSLGDQLLSLQKELISRGARIDVARKHADGLLSLEDTLADDAHLRINHAQDNLDALVAMEQRLISQDEQIIAAVESLELMSDLQAEFAKRLEGLEELRGGLMEIAMLESSVLRTVRTLEPLMELTNLRRLNGNDLQSIARGMLDRRAARIAASDGDDPTSAEDRGADGSMSTESLVPIPPTDQ